jgi:hypothetical protein
LGEPEFGALLVCEADIDIAAAGGDEVSFSRSQTLMQSASCCTFRYKFNSPWPSRQAKRKWPDTTPRPAHKSPEMIELLQRASDVGEGASERRADAVHGGDDCDRDARCNQAILDGGGSGFVLEKLQNDRLHGWFRPRVGVLGTEAYPSVPVQKPTEWNLK